MATYSENIDIEDGEIINCSDNEDVGEIFDVNHFDSLSKYLFYSIMEETNDKNDCKVEPEKKFIDNLSEKIKNNEDYLDDEEIVFMRGGSPTQTLDYSKVKSKTSCYYDEISCESESNDNFDKHSICRYENHKNIKKKRNITANSKNKKRAKCHKKPFNCSDNEKSFKRKKLCKFFLKNNCYRPSQCVYMHSEFPCKYYYLGLNCPDDKYCKLDHGKPLNKDMKEAFLRHIQFAPEECLGNFKKIPNEIAEKLFHDREKILKLMEKNKSELNNILDEKNFENNVPIMNNDINRNMNLMDLSLDNINLSFKDINDLANEEVKNSINTENYDDPNFKFLMIQFLLSIDAEKLDNKRINYNDIPNNLNIENYKEFLTDEQIDKLKLLNVHFVHHLCLLSVGHLNKLGISVAQLSQIQEKSLNIENVKLKRNFYSNTNIENCNCMQVSSTSTDTDMRILLPVCNNNIWKESKSSECSSMSQSIYNENQSDLEPDEESELVIDETILPDELSDVGDNNDVNTNNDAFEIKKEVSALNEKDDKENNNEIKQDLNNKIVFPFSPISQTKLNDYELLVSPTKLNICIHEKSDLDMRFPFTPVMLDFLPATEIDASINTHDKIEYKLIEVLIPEKILLSSGNLNKLSANNIDPRLRKEYFKSEQSNFNNNNYDATNKTNNSEITNMEDDKLDETKENLNKNDILPSILDIDPRKRFNNNYSYNGGIQNCNQLQNENISQQQSSLLQYFLQKSNWYNTQNSKIKMEINAIIAYLAKALKDYHNNSFGSPFNIFFLNCPDKIQEILIKLGISIDYNGKIIEENQIEQYRKQNNQIDYIKHINNYVHNDLMFGSNAHFKNYNSEIFNNNCNYINTPPPLMPQSNHIPSLFSNNFYSTTASSQTWYQSSQSNICNNISANQMRTKYSKRKNQIFY